jgi:hypothetical protein
MLENRPAMGRRSRPNPARLDGRLRSTKRLKALSADLQRQFGYGVNPAAIRRCAELQIAAETARHALLRNVPDASVTETVKLENLAARAWRDLRAVARKPPAGNGVPSSVPSLVEILKERRR